MAEIIPVDVEEKMWTDKNILGHQNFWTLWCFVLDYILPCEVAKSIENCGPTC